jgi:hypothetical protein
LNDRMLVPNLTDELDKLKNAPKHRHKLVGVLEKLPQPDKGILEDALGEPSFSSAALARALRASGHPIGETSVKRYRRDVLGMVK